MEQEMKKWTVLLALSLLMTTQAYALRCGTKLIREGDRVHKMFKHCGQPSSAYSEVVFTRLGIAKKVTYIYEKYGREQTIIAIGGVITEVD